MPIKPIDLQTLFTQLDRVGRERSAEKEGVALQQAIQGGLIQKKADESSKSVQGTKDAEDSANQKVAIRDDQKSSAGGQGGGPEEGNEGEGEPDAKKGKGGVFRDPQLGGNIDILR